MMRRQAIFLILFMIPLAMVTLPAEARAPARDHTIYYRIGGANTVRPPENAFATTTSIPASAEIGLRYSCGQFDPLAGLLTAFDQVVVLLENIDQVLAAALAALPMYIIQRANPGLYDLLQNLLLRADELVQISLKNCRQMEYEIAQGKDPYQEWAVLSTAHGWRAAIGLEGFDIVQTERDIDQSAGLTGVPWLCGERAGGEGMAPIAVVGDVTRAGWNTLMNREACATGSGGTGEARLAEVWPSPEVASEWVTSVLGDVAIYTDGTPPQARPGVGPLAGIATETEVVREMLDALVMQPNPAFADLEELSVGGRAFISRSLLEALRDYEPAERDLLLTRLANDIATEQAIERLLLAKQLLLTGMLDPNVMGTPAQTQVKPFLEAADTMVESLLLDRRVRLEMASGTAVEVKEHDLERRGRSQGLGTARETFEVIDGGVSSTPRAE